MRLIERTTRFKKDYKRELKGRHSAMLQQELVKVLTMLINDEPLPLHYRDHALIGNWIDFRDCHLKPDLILIYRLPN